MNRFSGFPIQGKLIQSIPWAMIQPHELQAVRNHDQGLKRLAERGGLSAAEALDVLHDRRWDGRSFSLPAEQEVYTIFNHLAELDLIARVEQWRTYNQ